MQSDDAHIDTFVTDNDALSSEYTLKCVTFHTEPNCKRNTAAPSVDVRYTYSDAFKRPSVNTDNDDELALSDISPCTSDTVVDSATFAPAMLNASSSTTVGDEPSDTLPNDNNMH